MTGVAGRDQGSLWRRGVSWGYAEVISSIPLPRFHLAPWGKEPVGFPFTSRKSRPAWVHPALLPVGASHRPWCFIPISLTFQHIPI